MYMCRVHACLSGVCMFVWYMHREHSPVHVWRPEADIRCLPLSLSVYFFQTLVFHVYVVCTCTHGGMHISYFVCMLCAHAHMVGCTFSILCVCCVHMHTWWDAHTCIVFVCVELSHDK